MTFEERCRLSEQCLPEAPYREMLNKLHNEMLEAQPAPVQEPVAWADLNALTEQFNSVNCGTAYRLPGESRQPLYTSPPAQQQEPVAWTLLLVGEHNGIVGKAGNTFEGHPEHYRRVDVYTAPQQRTWVGLTDEEVLSEAKRFALGLSFPFNGVTTPEMFARAIEAKLKEKNT